MFNVSFLQNYILFDNYENCNNSIKYFLEWIDGNKENGAPQNCTFPTIFAHVKAKKKQESLIRRSDVVAKKQARTTLTIFKFKEIKIKEY